jgi:heme/copper-type cytochrome/quinol oxidase subunit 4
MMSEEYLVQAEKMASSAKASRILSYAMLVTVAIFVTLLAITFFVTGVAPSPISYISIITLLLASYSTKLSANSFLRTEQRYKETHLLEVKRVELLQKLDNIDARLDGLGS